MKIDNIINEAGVTDLTSFRQEKHEKNVNAANEKIQQAKQQHFNEIDHVIASTIDRLSHMTSQQQAEQLVYNHLSDLVMAYDLEH